jgi:ABC-type branched-subunit amino acid transport system ATPase component
VSTGAPGTTASQRLADHEASATPLLEVDDLRVSYAGVRALRGVSLAVPEGAIVAVLGNNGAGKTTLLRAISGTLRMHRGAIEGGAARFGGRALSGLEPAEIVRAGVVQVPEGRRVFADLTVEENLRAGGLSARGRARRTEARTRVYDLFPRLFERRTQRAGLLSGGEQQMLGIGRALMSEPRVLMLDEPSLGLAPQIVDRIAEIVVKINEQGTSVVLVEQNAAMAFEVADRAYVLEVGRVALEGAARDLARSDEVRDRYLGVALDGAAPAAPAPGARTAAAAPAAPAAPAAGPAADERAEDADSAAPRPARRDPRPLHVEGVTVRFGGLVALNEVALSVEPGSTHAVIGPNGAGKSTLLNVLTGVYRASAGTVRYGDDVLTGRRPPRIAALGVSRTFQNLALSPATSVRENLLLGRHRLTHAGFVAAGLGLPRARREQREQERVVAETAAILDLSDKLDHPVGDLPYGDRKRIELARALCTEPSLLLLDEPVAGMTADEAQRMAQAILRLREELGISILLVEHNMQFVMGLADRVTVLDFGRCIADGPPDRVQSDPEVLRAYLGSRRGSEEAAR